MKNQNQSLQDYQRIEQAIQFIEKNYKEHPSLDAVASHVGLSPYHFQRLFKRFAGISPTQFAQFLTADYAKSRLLESQNVLDASFEAGLSGPGRLHDLLVSFEAVTPGEYKTLGRGIAIRYGFHSTPFGECLIGITPRGICHFAFLEGKGRTEAFGFLRQDWIHASFQEDPEQTRRIVNRIFQGAVRRRSGRESSQPFHLLLKGTNFQVKVWEALLQISLGEIASYEKIARLLGAPSSTRAVASAIAKNPVAFLIPCHRVILKSGGMHNYRWGALRKKAILAWEAGKFSKNANECVACL